MSAILESNKSSLMHQTRASAGWCDQEDGTQELFPRNNRTEDYSVPTTSSSPEQELSSKFVPSKECKSSGNGPQFDLNEGSSPSATPPPTRPAQSSQEIWVKRECMSEPPNDLRRMSWLQERKGGWEHVGTTGSPVKASPSETESMRTYISLTSGKEPVSEITHTERDLISHLTRKALFMSQSHPRDEQRPLELTLFEGGDVGHEEDDFMAGGSVLTMGQSSMMAWGGLKGGVKRRDFDRSPSSSAWSDERRGPRRCSPETPEQFRGTFGRGGSLDFNTWSEDMRAQKRGPAWELTGRFKEEPKEGSMLGSMNRLEQRRSMQMESTLESTNQRGRDPRRQGLSRSEVAEGSGDGGNRGVRVYKCSVCDRGFSSYQALGGHKSSHKREYTRAQQRTGLHLPLGPVYVMSRPMGLEGAVMTAAPHHLTDWGLQNLGLQVQQPIYIQQQQPGVVLLEDPGGSQAASQLQQLSAYQKSALRFAHAYP